VTARPNIQIRHATVVPSWPRSLSCRGLAVGQDSEHSPPTRPPPALTSVPRNYPSPVSPRGRYALPWTEPPAGGSPRLLSVARGPTLSGGQEAFPEVALPTLPPGMRVTEAEAAARSTGGSSPRRHAGPGSAGAPLPASQAVGAPSNSARSRYRMATAKIIEQNREAHLSDAWRDLLDSPELAHQLAGIRGLWEHKIKRGSSSNANSPMNRPSQETRSSSAAVQPEEQQPPLILSRRQSPLSSPLQKRENPPPPIQGMPHSPTHAAPAQASLDSASLDSLQAVRGSATRARLQAHLLRAGRRRQKGVKKHASCLCAGTRAAAARLLAHTNTLYQRIQGSMRVPAWTHAQAAAAAASQHR
jgi:hypothetical protein